MNKLLITIVAILFSSTVWAQDKPKTDAEKIADLENQVKTLTAQLQKANQPTPQEQEARTIKAYTDLFAAAKKQAGPGCKAAHGKLQVAVDQEGKVTVTCKF